MNNNKNQNGIIFILFFLVMTCLVTPQGLFASEKRSIALLPFVLYADKSMHEVLRPVLKSVLTARLFKEGLDVIDEQQIVPLLNEKEQKGIKDKKRAQEIAKLSNAGYAIFGTVASLGDEYSLDLVIIDLTKDTFKTTRVSQSAEKNKLITKLGDVAHQFKAIIDGVDYNKQKLSSNNKQNFSNKSNLSEDQTSMGLFFNSTTEGHEPIPMSQTSLPMKIISFDTGDLDGDGKTELIFLTRQKIFIYHRNDNSLTLIDSYEGSGSDLFFAISVGDADKNGRDEMYVAASYTGRARTTVFEWQGKEQFNVLFKETGHIRIVKDKRGGAPILLYQDSQMAVSINNNTDQAYDQFFKGGIYEVRYDKKGNQLAKTPITDFGKGPGKGPQLHTLIRYDMDNDGRIEYLGLGTRYSKLTVWTDSGTVIWRGNKKRGGTNNYFQDDRDDLSISSNSARSRITINAPPAIVDVDNDGNPELLAIDNISRTRILGNSLVYTSAKLYAYKIEGTNLSHQIWTTKKFEDSIIGVCNVDKTVYLAMFKGYLSPIWSKGSSRFMWFE